MICIFSTSRDSTTSEVMRWLWRFGIDRVVRFNSDITSQPIVRIERDSLLVRTVEGTFDLYEADAVWYRKGGSWLCTQHGGVTSGISPLFDSYLGHRLRAEEDVLSDYLHSTLSKRVPVLCDYAAYRVNKLEMLEHARATGLPVPDFRIVTTRADLIEAMREFGRVIAKPLADCIHFADIGHSERSYVSYAEIVDERSASTLPPQFGPSLVQRYVEKSVEVRTAYLTGRFYSMAILSQRDPQTRQDFRRYNDESPNRAVPYNLPADIEIKLKRFFDRVGLNTGSVDLILTPDGDHVFLEVNPVGQFGMVSQPCNYYLEREFARALIALARP